MSQSNAPEPIAVIGGACRFAGGANSPSKLWELLKNPHDVLSEIPESRFNVDGFYHEDGSHHGHNNVRHSYILDEDIRAFDAQFFGIKPVEARAMDPQQRFLLETVYEALEAAGLSLQSLKGSDTAAFVGLMCNDYEFVAFRDLDTLPTYHATGAARSIMSNRISYFFDWHGPAVTLDTACSSSLYAVYYAAQALRSGTSRTAIACGSNLILGPENYITESKLKMLSPESRSRMWDASANGYARGEGVAAVVLKTLSSAIEDGDHIECIIRGIDINQDGATNGITMPSATAQTDLIRATYSRANLDPLGAGRPQYFEAHGTGTPAGDPIEAEAISRSFFPRHDDNETLYVGSIKTVLGHTEGTAGVASLMKASLALQHSVIPPNLLFDKLSPAIEPFYNHLEVPTGSKPWPVTPKGQPRRASVNSFGFGGANAHVILESFEKQGHDTQSDVSMRPYCFSAGSEQSLVASLEAYAGFLEVHGESIRPRDLAWTLSKRRSVLPFKVAYPAGSIQQLRSNIKATLEESKEKATTIGTRSSSTGAARILGIFTGQGAQYPRMGAELLEHSSLAQGIIRQLDLDLKALPESDRPTWSLATELRAGPEVSRLDHAELSQPLCTAVQIVLVQLLRAAGVEFSAVVGHSSGEIGAAYAAGYISARDALYIAYYRGLHAAKAASPNGLEVKGAMMAVGTSKEDAEDILGEFTGQVTLAACNSSASVTLSGDEEAINELSIIFGDEGKFRRKLRVDKAYHSAHMLPCSQPYVESLRKCGAVVQRRSNVNCTWYSTVYEETDMHSDVAISKLRDGTYWADNMKNPVLFYQGLQRALAAANAFDLVLEVGPHFALKGPAMQTISEVLGRDIPYEAVLMRGRDSVEALSESLGFVWKHEGPSQQSQQINLDSFEAAATGVTGGYEVVKGLPSYQWGHDKSYWHESRRSRQLRTRKGPVHPLLGHEDPDSSPHQRRWRNLLRERELPWLSGHQLQGRTVFPATGYVSTLLEAARRLVDENESLRLIEISNFTIHRAITFDEDDAGIEILVVMENIQRDETRQITSSQFTLSSAVGKEANTLTKVATAFTEIFLGQPDTEILPAQQPNPANMVEVAKDRFYSIMGDLGYGYDGQFRTLSNLKRKLGVSVGRVGISRLDDERQEPLLGHPGTLDCALQAILLAYSYPGDGMLWSLHVPTVIRRIRVNPALCGSAWNDAESVPIRAATNGLDGAGLVGDAEIFGSHDSAHVAVQIEGLRAVPFVGAMATEDDKMFARTRWVNLSADPAQVTEDSQASSFEKGLIVALERTALFYLRKFQNDLPQDHPAWTDPVFSRYLNFARHMTGLMENGSHRYARKEWRHDTLEDVTIASAPYTKTIDMKQMLTTARAMPKVFAGEENILEHLLPSGLLDEYYVNGIGLSQSAEWLGRIVKQISDRYTQMNILEVGAGTGGATKRICKQLGPDGFSTFTYTDISTGFFEEAATVFAPYRGRMIFKALDASTDPVSQGFTPGSYDMIVAWFVIHATPKLEKTLRNLRRLLRPGGYLVVGEWVSQEWTRDGFVFGTMPGWWTGADEGRVISPCVNAEHWDEVLRNSGFSGVDTITSEDACHGTHSASIFVSQAVDETVTYLREPLAAELPPSLSGDEKPIRDLIIVGGSSLGTSRLVTQTKNALSKSAVTLKTFKTLGEVIFDNEAGVDTTLVCLSELDKPVFETLDADTFAALKKLVAQEHTLLWVTQNRRTGSNPYINMGVSFVQTASHEVPGLHVQCIDFEDGGVNRPIDARSLAEQVLRFHHLSARSQDQKSTDLMWSAEPDIIIDPQGNEFAPRFEPDSALNERYNSFKRTVTRDLNIADTPVSIHEDDRGFYSLHEEHPSAGSRILGDVVELRVTSAALTPISTPFGPRFVTLGLDSTSGNQHLVLADKLSSIVTIPRADLLTWEASTTTPQAEAAKVAEVVSHLIANTILEHSLQGERLIIHNTLGLVAAAISRRAEQIGVHITFTSSNSAVADQDLTPGTIVIPSYATHREVSELVSKEATRFISFTPLAQEAGIISSLPPYCQIEAVTGTERGKTLTSLPSLPSLEYHLRGILAKALEQAEAQNINGQESSAFRDLITPGDIIKTNYDVHQRDHLSVLSWLGGGDLLLPARVSRVDAKQMFRSDKTYWLVGLSRDLGLSICDWMISKGAKHIVITSRSPTVDPEWKGSWKRRGVEIKIIANDICDPVAVERVYKEICSILPPLAGIMQGAMVLVDRPIRDMTLEEMLKVLGPKVEGSRNLERVLGSTQLDFLIYLSSMARVLCNVGQANYSAANAFMAGLAVQRRRRGLAASVANISVVAGAGYVQRVEGDDGDNYLKLTGLRRISEIDTHQQLAEAILIGQPDVPLSLEKDLELGSALRVISPDDEQFMPYWTGNPKFSRFILNKQGSDYADQGANRKGGASISERLESAKSKEEVFDAIKDSFLTKIRAVLQIDDDVDDESLMRRRSTEIGMDSLIAVDLRSWFLKHLSVSIPVLEILSDISMVDLVGQAVEKLPSELIPNLVAVDGDSIAALVHRSESVKASSIDDSSPSTTLSYSPSSEPSGINNSCITPLETPLQTPLETPLEKLFATEGGPSIGQQLPSIPDSSFVSIRDELIVPRLTLKRSLKLSPAQSMFWVVHSLLEDKTTLNHTGIYRLTGMLRIHDFKAAVGRLSKRHEALRTIFCEGDNGQVQQGILLDGALKLEHKHVSSMAEVEEEFENITKHVHNLSVGQLLRMVLLSLSGTENFLVINIHHINFDGMCVQIMLRDLEELYSMRRPISRTVLQYADFAENQRNAALDGAWDSDLAFWGREFANLPGPLPLSRARIATRQPLKHYAAHRVDVFLNTSLAAKIRGVAQANRATAFHFYLATFRTLLQRLILDAEGHGGDVCIGIADSNRNDLDTMSSLGPYVNLLPLRFRASDKPTTFAECLTSARDKTYSALAHAAVPFQAVLHSLGVDHDTRFSPLFQAFLDYRLGARQRMKFADCMVETVRFEPGRTAYDLSIDIMDYQDGGALISFFGQSALYAESDVQIFAACYEDLLESFVEEPATSLTKQDWQYPTQQVSAALELGRGPSFNTKWPDTLIHQLDAVAHDRRQKAAIVVADSEQYLTYEDMQLMIQKLVTVLLRAEITPGQVIAVFQEAGPDWVCSMLAIMKVGAIYVPLGFSTSPTRLAMIVADCQPAAVIVNNSSSKRDTFGIPLVIDISNLDVEGEGDYSLTTNKASIDDPALILYTSGTTGKPKGILLHHSSLKNEVEVSAEVYGLDSSIVVLQQSSFGFDMSVLQIFLGLALGGTLCIIPHELRGDSVAIVDSIVRHHVTYTCATPTEFGSWLRLGDTASLRSSAWSVALSGGEAVTKSLLESFRELEKADLRLFNGYGPTETTCCSTKIELMLNQTDKYHTIVPAGYPSANESIYIIDDQMRLLPPGFAGEVAIGGAGVAAKYLNNDEMSRESFVHDPFSSEEYRKRGWATMYRTKDRGRLNPDGTVTVEGRIGDDTQIKLRGVRIDLREIESLIIRASEGAIIGVCASTRGDGDTRIIVAHVVLARDNKLGSEEEQDQYLSRLSVNLPLPPPLRLTALFVVQEMPASSSGKLDRRAVEALPVQHSVLFGRVGQEDEAKSTSRLLTNTEHLLKMIWLEVLDQSVLMEPAKLNAETNFFHVGGSSILMLEVGAQIQQVFGLKPRLVELFESSTIEAMARLVDIGTSDTKVEHIDWHAEAVPPTDIAEQFSPKSLVNLPRRSQRSGMLKTIVLTGAAGDLGRHILDQLLADNSVRMVICVALRKIESRIASGALPAQSGRLAYFAGDLRQPRLGLSESAWAAIASQADVVVHVGADVSHAKRYRTLRDANVGGTTEAARLCLVKGIPLHFVSSAQVAMLGAKPPNSLSEMSVRVAEVTPSQDDGRYEGYASSKWVCERLLENLVEAGSGLRVWIHRPSIITAPSGIDETAALVGQPDAPLLRSVLFYSRVLRAVPSTGSWFVGGTLDFVGMETVVRDLVKAILHEDDDANDSHKGVSYVHHTGDEQLALEDLLQNLTQRERDDIGQEAASHLPPFERLPLTEWSTRAQAAGMHALLATIFENAQEEMRPMYFPKFVKNSNRLI